MERIEIIRSQTRRVIQIKSRFYFLLFVVGFALMFQSCSDNAIYDQSYSFKNAEWQKNDTAVFKVDIKDTNRHRIFITLRTTTEYMYNNLWVYISITSPDNSTSKVATNLKLAYPDGAWIGTVSGSLVERTIEFTSKSFPIKGTYTFSIRNATQQAVITEVEDISLRIE